MAAEVLDFIKKEAQALQAAPLLDRHTGPVIWGRELCTTADQKLEQILEQFLHTWDFTAMPYCIHESVDSIAFTTTDEFKKTAMQNLNLLERLRIFGGPEPSGPNEVIALPAQGGDLSMRRDGDRFLWHFIGARGCKQPSGFKPVDFWEAHPETSLRLSEGRALLWGTQEKIQEQENAADPSEEAVPRWRENRVGWADLAYPFPKSAERVCIRYLVFSAAGQEMFVWWQGLQRWRHG